MEFVGNQINFKTVLATLIVAFFIGRINLFGGTFPAAIALITVMAAVSTVYIYLVPVMAGAMATFAGGGLDFYGDLFAMIFCGIFFLFFHNKKFTINQRTAVAVAAAVIFNCGYYAWENILYLLSLQTLLTEAVAIIIYIRVFNTLARALFVGKAPRKAIQQVAGEKVGLAVEIAVISIIGSADFELAVVTLWILTILIVQYCKGIQWALSMAAMAVIYWKCQYNSDIDIFASLFVGLIAGWYLASLMDGRYRKTILALTVFLTMAISGPEVGGQIYGIAAAAAVFVAIPSDVLVRLWCTVEEWLVPEDVSDTDLRLAEIRKDLQKKRATFRGLANLYNSRGGSRQMVSYQFEGMVRTVDRILEDLNEKREAVREKENPVLTVGTASYAFEEVSGDSSLSFSFGDNHQALIISDGMGKGSRASAESTMVVHTLSRLLEAGFDVDLAMKTVNAILMTDNQAEMFATVDLAIINRATGRTQIFKMGAASTFVKHDGKVAMLKRPAPPVGILEGIKLEYLDVKLKKGDLLIMVSDGVTDCDRQDPDCRWLRERLVQIQSRDPETVAELIVNKAAEKYGIRERDDLTVMVAAI